MYWKSFPVKPANTGDFEEITLDELLSYGENAFWVCDSADEIWQYYVIHDSDGKDIDVKIEKHAVVEYLDKRRRLSSMDISFSDEYAYKDGPARCKEQEIYTDNDIVWSEIGIHALPSADGASTVNFADGFNKWLPEKAEELGYKQAYLEACAGMVKTGIKPDEIMNALGLSEQQLIAITNSKIMKYRIIPTSKMENVKLTAAEHFKMGYNLAYEMIEKNTEQEMKFDITAIRKSGLDCVRKEIRKLLKEELYEEYSVLYQGVI